MVNLSILLLGATLALISIAAILYSVSDLRNTSARRHQFFKGIRMFTLFYLFPVFIIVLLTNLKELILEDYITIENSKEKVIYILSAVLNLFLVFQFVFRPVNNGINLFRKHNRDNLKYTRAISKSRNGLIYILVIIIITVFINRPG